MLKTFIQCNLELIMKISPNKKRHSSDTKLKCKKTLIPINVWTKLWGLTRADVRGGRGDFLWPGKTMCIILYIYIYIFVWQEEITFLKQSKGMRKARGLLPLGPDFLCTALDPTKKNSTDLYLCCMRNH